MSIATWRTPFLSIGPRVDVGRTWLWATTRPFLSALSLFAYRRELRVDAAKRQIRLSERRWWRTRVQQLPFDALDHVEYRYAELPTSFFLSWRGGRRTVERADTVERFSVALVLREGGRLPLFTFFGDGAVTTGPVGVLLGDEWLDMEGAQADESLGFIQHIQRLTGLGLGPRRFDEMRERLGPACASCGQRNARRSRCLYCGAELTPTAERPSDAPSSLG